MLLNRSPGDPESGYNAQLRQGRELAQLRYMLAVLQDNVLDITHTGAAADKARKVCRPKGPGRILPQAHIHILSR